MIRIMKYKKFTVIRYNNKSRMRGDLIELFK